MSATKHLFFDLDHTLWDFDRNSKETLLELYEEYHLAKLGLNSSSEFIETYTRNNHYLWSQYHLGQITKDTLRALRFRKTFLDLGLQAKHIPANFEEDYVRLSPQKTHLFESTIKVLQHLSQRYQMHIISNGFKEATLTKMQGSLLNPYFQHVIISEEVGVNKPDKAIFEFALDKAQAHKKESVMIGDSIEADIYGAQNYGIRAIYFNPCYANKPLDVKEQIHHLEELLNIF